MKKFKLLFLLILIFFTFTGCLSKTELEDYAYVISVGVDKGSNDNYIVTYQIAVPIKIAGEGSAGSGKDSTSLVTLETDTLYNSISRANTMISKEITLSHNKLIVLSEEVAKEGIESILNAFVTNREIRPKTSIIVYRGLAKELLANLEPILEKNPARYYDLLLDSNQYTGYAIDNTLFNFYLASKDTLSSPYALLTEPVRNEESSIEIPSKSKENPDSTPSKRNASSENKNTQETNSETSNSVTSKNTETNNSGDTNSQNNNTSGKNLNKNASGGSQNNQTPSNTNEESSQSQNLENANSRKNKEDLENTNSEENKEDSKSTNSEENKENPKTANIAGIAIFTNDKLVGEIKNEQILSHVLLLGEMKKVNIDIEDIEDNSKTTVIKLRQIKQPKINVEIENNTPKIDILIRLECDLITSGSQIDYTDQKNKHKLSEAIKNKLSNDMNIYLTKISKDFKADPIGFGKYYRSKVLTLKEIENLKWREIFPNSEFNVEFQLHLDTTQMVSNQVS